MYVRHCVDDTEIPNSHMSEVKDVIIIISRSSSHQPLESKVETNVYSCIHNLSLVRRWHIVCECVCHSSLILVAFVRSSFTSPPPHLLIQSIGCITSTSSYIYWFTLFLATTKLQHELMKQCTHNFVSFHSQWHSITIWFRQTNIKSKDTTAAKRPEKEMTK